MRPGERIPLHDHRDGNSGGKIDANAGITVVTSGGSGATGGEGSASAGGGGLDEVQEDGATVLANATILDAGHGLDVLDEGSGIAGLNVDEDELVVSTGALTPAATITTVKSASNPTFNFNAIPESMVKVSDTYFALYLNPAPSPDEYRIASSSSRDGPWTDVGAVLTLGSQGWEGNSTEFVAYLMEHDSVFYIFYGIASSGTGQYAIGYATSNLVTGPYTKYASNPVMSPGAGGAWDSLGVGEMSVMVHDNQWLMAFMGNKSSPAGDLTEQVGIATAAGPNGPWTKYSGNPVLAASGSGFDQYGCADPSIFFANGYYWIAYAGIGGGTTGHTLPWKVGLAYATKPDGPWMRYSGNPIMSVGTGGSFDDEAAWRAFVYEEAGLYSIIYGGMPTNPVVLTDAKGGNARMIVDTSSIGGGVTGFAVPSIVLGTSAAAGSATTAVRSDATLLAFDATVPVTQAVGDAAAAGAATVAARRDHKHGMPAFGSPVATGAANSDGVATTVPRSDHVHQSAATGADDHIHIVGEAQTGDGSTTVFLLANEAVPGTLAAYNVAGARVPVTLGGANDQVTFATQPGAGTFYLDYVPVQA